MNDNYNATLLYYARQLLTEDQLQKLGAIPLYGANGIRSWISSRSLEAFAKLYFPDEFTLPFAPIHYQMLDDMQQIHDRLVSDKPGLKLARAIPRNHAKSTFYSRLLPLHSFLFNWSKLTVLLANNDDSARRLVGNIKSAIETNDRIKEDFPAIKGSQWGVERLENNAGSIITGYGVGSGAIRGISIGQYRPSLVILDDIDDDKSVRSAVELSNAKDWFDRAVSALGDNVHYTTSFIAVGTIIRKTSLMQYIVNSSDYHSVTESAIKQFATNEALWNDWQNEYLELSRRGLQPKDASEDTFYQTHKEELLAGTEVLWNRPDAYYYIMVYKLARGSKAFQSEMQNDPTDDGALIGTIVKVPTLPSDIQMYKLFGALDSSIKGGETNDPSAWIELLYNPYTKQMVVSYVDSKKRSYAQTISDVSTRIKGSSKRYEGIFIETNSAGEIIANEIQKNIAGSLQAIYKVYNTIPKNERIGILSQYIESGQLTFYSEVQTQVFDELSGWPIASNQHHFDTIDALSMIIAELKNKGLLDLVEDTWRF